MADLHTLGPIGFRGPAAAHIPDHLTVVDAGVRTAQLISPGDECPSNALVGEILDLIGEEVLYITSANTSSHVSKQIEAAHYEMRAIQREFGHRDDVDADRAPQRAREPAPLPAPPAVLDLDRRLPPGPPGARAPRLARRAHDRAGREPPRPRAHDRRHRARARSAARASRPFRAGAAPTARGACAPASKPRPPRARRTRRARPTTSSWWVSVQVTSAWIVECSVRAQRRERVLHARRHDRVDRARHEPVALELAQRDGQHPLRDPVDLAPQLVEAQRAPFEQRDRQQRPLVRDAVEDLAHLAALAGVPLVRVPGVGHFSRNRVTSKCLLPSRPMVTHHAVTYKK